MIAAPKRFKINSDASAVGVDISMTRTGIAVVGECSGGQILANYVTSRTLTGAPIPPTMIFRMLRAATAADTIVECVNQGLCGLRPAAIAIEGYAFAASSANAHALTEFGALVRMGLLANFPNTRFLEVPPSVLKKFVTGNGRATKAEVVSWVVGRWGVPAGLTEDEYDAIGLAMFAGVASGCVEPLTDYQRKATARSIADQ